MNSSPNWSNAKWSEATWIAFDTETTGKYPLESEICEIAAVKWKDGVEVGTFSSLIKPRRPMSETVIKIHGITNEMVAGAPSAAEVLPKFLQFIQGGVLLAHHAQFDLGFVAAQLDELGLQLPEERAICTSLLAQAVVTETPNHKLQTLIAAFGIDPGQAHRATDDARACLQVALLLFKRMQDQSPTPLTVENIASRMLRRSTADVGLMNFKRFSISDLRKSPDLDRFVRAIQSESEVTMTYAGGSRPGKPRRIRPVGIIRQLDGDALVAVEVGESLSKRYWIKDVQSIV